ncbi:hypothetical protein PHDIMM138B_27505 [Phytobacter diazotrophicus]
MAKSIDRVRFGASGRKSESRSVASPLRLRLRFTLRPLPLVINAKGFTPQKLPDTPVTKAPAFKCQLCDADR